ncbi:MAG: NAD+ synthase [Actinomycetota bacterium]|nr:NAD+ synthase [Actinomycetota bacterium]
MSILRICAAQVNPGVGDFEGNFKKIRDAVKNASAYDCDIIVFPELALTGYPPEDLLLKPSFLKTNLKYIEKLKELSCKNIIICGSVRENNEIFNSAFVFYDNKIVTFYDKQNLPNYSVFDEERYFQRGNGNKILNINGCLVGLSICEDIYYAEGPVKIQSLLGSAELVINIAASPYHIGKPAEREKMLHTRAVDSRVCILYVNLIGGQDELVFDGNSMLIDAEGIVLARCAPFEEDMLIYDIDLEEVKSLRLKDARFKIQRKKLLESKENHDIEVLNIPDNNEKSFMKKGSSVKSSGRKILGKAESLDYEELITCEEDEILKALVLGTRDYFHKNGFGKAVLGLSGGIDSAICAVIAFFALGNENVTGILMPSPFSSKSSIYDSLELANNLKIRHIEIPISGIYNSYIDSLKEIFQSGEINLTKENIQARIRGNILMAMSNEFGWLVLSTGNKSETSVGYCTLYGDMAGGLSPIKDIYKTRIYKLCEFINKEFNNIIPGNILTKAPSAELKPGQTDQDCLPPYDLLDMIIKSYIEDDMDFDYIKNVLGLPEEIVRKVIRLIDMNEYKRRQGSPGIKITQRAFGKDRRFPITNKFRG